MADRLVGQVVLIVEDEPLIAECISMVVIREGAKVVGPAASVRQAMQLLNEEKITLAVLDINLQDGESTPVIQSLIDKNIPFVIATAGSLPNHLQSVLGKTLLFSKPLVFSQLIDNIVLLIESSKSQFHDPSARLLGHALIIEDEFLTAEIIEAYLRHLGFTSIAHAASEDAAMAAASKNKPDIIFADIVLLQGNGISAATSIENRYGFTPSIYITSYPDLAGGIKSSKIITKPFTSGALAAAVEAAYIE